MKRSSNRSSHAAVLGLQTFKGFKRGRVSDHARDLPSAGRVGGLALCTGLGLGHGSGTDCGTQRHKAGLLLAKFGGIGRTPYGAEAISAGRAQVDRAEAAVLNEGQAHGGLRSVTVEPSYTVTSDDATTVGREIRRAA